MYRRLILFLCLFMTAMLSGRENPVYENFLIEKIDFEVASPNTTINKDSLQSRIKSKVGNYFSQTQFDQDLKALAKEFSLVEPSIGVMNEKVYITIRLSLRPQIRSIQYEGNNDFTNRKLQSELGIELGQSFDAYEFNKQFHKLKGLYVSKGYFEAEIDYTVQKDPVTNEVDIIIRIKEGRTGKIKEICFHGFTPYERSCILDMMVLKQWNFVLSFLYGQGVYHEEMMLHDQYQIVNFLQNRGYADASVTIVPSQCPPKNGLILDITAHKGEAYSVGNITFEGNVLFSDEQIRECFQLCEEGVYSPEFVRQTANRISDLYGACGYIENIVDYDLTLDPDFPRYSVHFHIDEGAQYRIGMIKILGNTSTQNSVILHEILLVPGEVFNIEYLRLTEERLKNIGYFKCVNVYAVKTEGPCALEGNYRDVHIEVEETSTGSLSAFFGLSNVETIFGGIQLSEKNFNISGIPYMFRCGPRVLRGGGEYLSLATSIGDKSRSFNVSWTKPYFHDTPWIVGVDLEKANVRYISDNYEVNSQGVVLHAKYPLNRCLTWGVHYRYRDSKVKVTEDEDNPIGDAQLRREAQNDGRVSAMGTSFVFDSTDSLRQPMRGYRTRLEGEYAGLGGDHHFYSVGYINSYFFPVDCKSSFKIRADFKYILPVGRTTYESLPIDERLFIGGNNTVRGYEVYALGPKFYGTDDPRGGISLNLFSLEYNYYVSERFELFSFFDAGMLSKDSWSFGNLNTSWGFGTRICVFGGGPPITLGYGFPIKPKFKSDVKRFFFSVGGAF